MNEVDQLLELAWQTAGKIQPPTTRSLKYVEIAEIYLESGNKVRCLEVLAEALKILELLKHPDEKATQLALIASLFVKMGDIGRARELFTRAYLLSRAAETPIKQAGALYSLACEYADAGLCENAAKTLSELYKIAVDPENYLDIACELINIAEIYSDIGMVEKASQILQEVVDISTALKDNWFKAERLIEAAEIFAGIEGREKAAEVLEAASPIVDRIDEANRPSFMFKMVDIYTATSHKSKALDVLVNTLSIINHNLESPTGPQDLIEAAKDYALLGDKEASANILTQAKTVIESIEDVKEKISGLISVGETFNEMDRIDQGLEAANQALALGSTLQDNKAVPFILGNIAVLYAGLKDRDQADRTVALIIQCVQETPVKTSGLGAIIHDLTEIGENALALNLVKIIREPEVKVGALTGIAQSLIEANEISDNETKQSIQYIVKELNEYPN